MEKSSLDSIKSKNILKRILNFIKEEKLILRLFLHSKLFLNKLDIKLIDYQKIFFQKFCFENYLCLNQLYENKLDIDKNELQKNLKDDLLKIKFDSKNIINAKEYLIYYFKKYYEKTNEDESDINKNKKILIDIYSPFFEILYKTEIFTEIFNIKILPRSIIHKNNLKNDYITIFDNLYKFNPQYSSISIYCNEIDDFNVFTELGIHLNNIKNLIVFVLDSKNIFSFSFKELDNSLKNLKHLRIDSKYTKSLKIKDELFENINNLYFLEELQLNDVVFENNFIIKLFDIKKLYLSNCENISFVENRSYNIEIFELNNCLIITPEKLLNFPKLKKFNFNNISNGYYKISLFELINSPQFMVTDKEDNLNNNISAEYLMVKDVCYSFEIIEKIISMKNLKLFDITLYNSCVDEILKINGENTSVKEANIFWIDNGDCILYNLQNKFPNLSTLNIKISDYSQGFNQNSYSSIEITENPKCTVNQFSINSFLGMNIKFFIQSFENLVSVKFDIRMRFNLSNNNFPLFKDNCSIIFKYLKNFTFIAKGCYRLDFDILNNIYNNIDKMPNLKSFILICNQKDITEEFSIKLLRKLLSLNLDNIELCCSNKRDFFNEKQLKEYSLNELKELYPKMDINFPNHISIRKFLIIKNFIKEGNI